MLSCIRSGRAATWSENRGLYRVVALLPQVPVGLTRSYLDTIDCIPWGAIRIWLSCSSQSVLLHPFPSFPQLPASPTPSPLTTLQVLKHPDPFPAAKTQGKAVCLVSTRCFRVWRRRRGACAEECTQSKGHNSSIFAKSDQCQHSQLQSSVMIKLWWGKLQVCGICYCSTKETNKSVLEFTINYITTAEAILIPASFHSFCILCTFRMPDPPYISLL